MVGKPDQPMPPEGTPDSPVPAKGTPDGSVPAEGKQEAPGATGREAAKKPLAKTFHCTNCGASVTIRYPGASMSVVCESCHSVIDALDENKQILTKYFKATSAYNPFLPLGSRGKLKGRTWEVIGFMVRSDLRSGYSWREYLLFNPFYGYRWLTEDQGHWNLITTIKRKPERKSSAVYSLDGRDYKIFNSGRAQVDYVIGEFYWRVVMGSQVEMVDYIDPPQMLSMDKNDQEVVWSLGEYITPKEIKDAFGAEKILPRTVGIAPTQPDKAKDAAQKMGLLFLLFWGIITCTQVYFLRTSANAQVTEYNGTFIPNTKQSDITTPVFTLSKDLANVAITFSAPVKNSWFWAAGEMVNNETGVAYPIEQTVEYYFGTDSDGAWSEGGNTSRQMISSVPAGKYYINLDTESGSFKTIDGQPFQVTVQRDVPVWDNYVWTTIFLSLLPICSWIIMRRIEVARWSNSDFSPYNQTYSRSSY